MDEVLSQLMLYVDEVAGLISEAAPIVWDILIKQVYVQVLNHVVWLVGFLVVLLITYKIPKDDETTDDWEGANYIASFLGYAVSIPVILHELYQIGARFINPAWYALKLLLETANIGG